eukprot:69775-Chlamydomonas_euryale.AAC.4
MQSAAGGPSQASLAACGPTQPLRLGEGGEVDVPAAIRCTGRARRAVNGRSVVDAGPQRRWQSPTPAPWCVWQARTAHRPRLANCRLSCWAGVPDLDSYNGTDSRERYVPACPGTCGQGRCLRGQTRTATPTRMRPCRPHLLPRSVAKIVTFIPTCLCSDT